MLVRSALHRDARKLPLAREVENIIRRQSLANNGVWYDPSDLSTLFQDAAGTIPVTAVEQPVGKILDKSGRGNHATQSTAGYKPVLSARVNALVGTERLGDGIWIKGAGVSVVGGFSDPKGGTSAWKVTAQSWDISPYQTSTVAPGVGTTNRGGVWLKGAAGGEKVKIDIFQAGVADNLSPEITLTTNWQYYEHIATSGTGTQQIGFGIWNSTGAQIEYYIAFPDLRRADITGCPNYQRVGVMPDYDTIGFPKYLAFDGIDDFLVTGNIDFSSSDKIAVAAGVRKLSDAALGCLCELSAQADTNNGAFYIRAPLNSSDSYDFISRGSAFSRATVQSYSAPISNVVALLSGISSDTLQARVSGVLKSSSSADQGTGNYGNYPLYIGRRGGTSQPFNGRLYGLAICGGMDDIYKLKKIERYLAQKTGVII